MTFHRGSTRRAGYDVAKPPEVLALMEIRRHNYRLDSWKAIAMYLGRDVRTAVRWSQSRGLPVYRLPGVTRSAVHSYKDEIDKWLKSSRLLVEKSREL